ncbi:hypothetical protein ABPG74_012041 [Tetrahymena malaccensis]
MIYCFPLILLLQQIQYWIYFYSKECYNGFGENIEDYIKCNLCLFIFTVPIFFAVFFGMFNQTLKYHVQEASDCKVLGKKSNLYYIPEKYEILYIDFSLKGQSFLGYGCISSQNNASLELSKYNQATFFNYDDTDRDSVYYWRYGQVKLPSWMCISVDTDYEELLNKRKCYYYFYNVDSTQNNQAYENAQNRNDFIWSKSFAVVTFKELNVPFVDYMVFLGLVFCPLICSLGFFSILLGILFLDVLQTYLKKLKGIEQIIK